MTQGRKKKQPKKKVSCLRLIMSTKLHAKTNDESDDAKNFGSCVVTRLENGKEKSQEIYKVPNREEEKGHLRESLRIRIVVVAVYRINNNEERLSQLLGSIL